MIEIKVYNKFNNTIKDFWLQLEKNAVQTPFHTFDWIKNWYSIVGQPLYNIKPQIIHISYKEETLAILPLGIRKKFGVKILEWLGGENTDYMGPIVHSNYYQNFKDASCWEKIQLALSKFDIIVFDKIEQQSVDFISRIGLDNFYIYEEIVNNKIHLNTKFEDYYQTVKKKRRSDLSRSLRRLKEIGDVEFFIAKSFNEKQEIIQSMIDQKSDRYRTTGKWNMFKINEYIRFYESLSNLKTNNFKIHCSALKINKTIIASHVGFIDNLTFYYIMPANVFGEWSKYSPSILLLKELIEWSAKMKIIYFDFTLGSEKYKKTWSNYERNIFNILKVKSFKGSMYLKIILFKNNLKKSALFMTIYKKIKKINF